MEAIMRRCPQPCVILEMESLRFVQANRAALRVLGRPFSSMAGRTPEELGFWGNPAESERASRLIYRRRHLKTSEWLVRDGNGELLNLLVSGRILHVDGRRMLLMQFVNITGYKQAELSLRRSRDDFQNIFMHGPQPFCITESDSGRILDVNGAWQRLYGYELDEVEGRDSLDLGIWMSRPDRDRALRVLGEVGQLESLETVHRHRDGTAMDVLVSAQMTSLDGRNVRVWQLLDISQRKRYEHAIRRLNQELEQRVAERTHDLRSANGELEAFSYSVAHDLRGPLRAIDGYSCLLREEQAAGLTQNAVKYLDRIHGNVSRMARLIEDLLACAQIGRRELGNGIVDMMQIALAVREDLLREHPRASIVVGDVAPVQGDAALLRQVLENLVSNALKFSAGVSGPAVEIGSTAGSGSITYWIRDNGVGFDMRYADKLFGVFERLHSAREFPGTGVGLAIVQRVVKRHKGRVWAESAPGAGATFYFQLPFAQNG